MWWSQLIDHRKNAFRILDRVSMSTETKRKGEFDDATLDLVSTTDVDDEETRCCLQQLVMEDNTKHSHVTWEAVHSQLMTTLATPQKKSINPMLSRFDYDDDDDDFDAFRVLYHGSYDRIAEDDCVPSQKSSFVDAAAEKQRYDFCCKVIQNECRDLFQYQNIWDVRLHQSLLVLLISQITVEEDCGHSLYVEEAIRTVASFLIDPSRLVDVKLAVLKILLLPQLSCMCCDDESSTATFCVLPEQGINFPIDGTGCSTTLQQQVLREIYAFCIAICFGVNELEYALDPSRTRDNSPLVSPMLLELRSTCLYLQEVHSIFYDLSNSRSLSNPATAGKLGRSEKQWEQVKSYLFETDSILLKDLDVLRSLYNTVGIRHVATLASVGYLRIHFSSNLPTDAVAQPKYCEALHNVAQFLVDWMVPDRQKFAVLKCLQCSVESTKATDRIFYRKVLSFCIDPKACTDSISLTSASADHEMDNCSYFLLLWDLRILCGQYLPQQRLRNILRLLWTKALPRVRGAMNAAGRMKHLPVFGATLVSSAQTVVSIYHSSPNCAL
jgi:hypothetical protein